jgi:5'-3' exonuclease
MKTAVLVDVCSVFFRYYFSQQPAIVNDQGWDVAALMSTVRWLCKKERLASSMVIMAFDESLGSGFRHDINPQYKANRALPTEDVIYQLELLKTIAQYLGFVVLASEKFEADDLIASAIVTLPDYHCTVYTRDKDLRQLVNERVNVLDFTNQVLWTPLKVFEEMTITPGQVPLYLSLVGDSSDNIQGVPGVGDKTARALLQEFIDWPGLLAYVQQHTMLNIRGGAHIRESLLNNEGLVKENLSLTQLRTDVVISLQCESLSKQRFIEFVALLEYLSIKRPLEKSIQVVSGYLL